jgi:GMP synthase (glutamine-hydrolysing)
MDPEVGDRNIVGTTMKLAEAESPRGPFTVTLYPEVVHTEKGTKILGNFVLKICGCKPTWNMGAYEKTAVQQIREHVGSGRVLCGVSGGVDSMVLLHLLNAFRQDFDLSLIIAHINHGLRPKEAAEEVFKKLKNEAEAWASVHSR